MGGIQGIRQSQSICQGLCCCVTSMCDASGSWRFLRQGVYCHEGCRIGQARHRQGQGPELCDNVAACVILPSLVLICGVFWRAASLMRAYPCVFVVLSALRTLVATQSPCS